MRTCNSSLDFVIHSRIASAARTARSGSSSCATGAPKTAMTASPMNFSTVPPKRSMSAFTRSWYGRSVARTSSGSARSERFVNPTRSTKSTETTFRSSPVGVSAASDRPHERQKRARSGFSSPQCGQTGARGSSQRPELTSMPVENALREHSGEPIVVLKTQACRFKSCARFRRAKSRTVAPASAAGFEQPPRREARAALVRSRGCPPPRATHIHVTTSTGRRVLLRHQDTRTPCCPAIKKAALLYVLRALQPLLPP